MAYFHCLIGGGSSGGGYTLTVTCDPDFAGTTITCTDGVTTLTATCPSASPYEVEFEIPNGGTWTVSGIVSGSTCTASIDIPDELELIAIPDGSTATPTDVIQTWLKCGGIFDKSYTTLNEVLADSTTLLALMSNNNAVDYLVRSTTWASGVTANSTAMTDIGANNYCANTLLSDSTWRNAICNSTYFESVLNVKVPTMTGDTTPSGEAITDSYHSTYPPYRAFDATLNSTFWATLNGPGATENHYLGYDFGEPVSIVKVGIINSSYNSGGAYNQGVKDFEVRDSDDKITWSNAVYSGTATKASSTSQGFEYFNFAPNGNHRYWIVFCKNNYGDAANIVISQLQFYGRKDV